MNNKILNNSLFFLICVSAFLPLVSIIPMTGDLWYTQYIAMLCLFYAGIAISLMTTNILLSLLMIWCGVSAIWVAIQHPVAMFTLLQVGIAMLGIKVISELPQKKRKWLLWCVLGMVLLQEILTVAQMLDLDPFFTSVKPEFFYRVVGFCGSRNQLGLYLGVVTPLVLNYAPILLPILLLGMCSASTASAWIGMAAGSLVFIYLKTKSDFVKIGVLILVCTGLFFYKFENISRLAYSERIMLYKHTVQSVENEKVIMRFVEGKKVGQHYEKEAFREVRCNKWFGYGLGNFRRVSPLTQYTFLINGGQPSHTYGHAHNDLLELYYETGRIGLGLGILLVLHFLYTFIRAKKTEILIVSGCCVLAQLVTSMGIFTVHTAIGGWLLVIFYGVYMGELKDGKNRQTGKTAALV